MPAVTVRLPAVLAEVLAGTRAVRVEAGTVAGALEELFAAHPELRVHLLDETGGFRQHVLCFHNGVNTRWLEDLEVPVEEGDELTVMQAVSGG